MAEVKNNFIKSKMNKDLDARLLPSGEYRNAVNAQISKSEGEGIGSLENVLGNYSIANIEPAINNLSAIGYYVDQVNNFIYVFLTDNGSNTYLSTSNNFIYRVSPSGASATKTLLVEGPFLNFSKLNPIYGVNLLESLLFWTDNRNQPRQINVTSAANDSTFYTTEDQISVAKYNPYKSISLWKQSIDAPGDYETTMKNVTSKFMPTGGSAAISPGGGGSSASFSLKNGVFPFYPNRPAAGQEVGVINASGEIVPLSPPVTVDSSTGSNQVTLTQSVTLQGNDVLVFFPNPYYNPDYAGDSAFLEDKFVRFSYRFKFDNNEYSLVAPFTQICFIPKQDGYFLTTGPTTGDNDQIQAVSSSIVSFMENKINSIGLQVPLPSKQNELINSFKVSEIDILYKESDGLSIKVVETIQASSLTGTDNFFEYIYTGKKPYKTLVEKEISRVYDKVPVRAFAQESSGNRVIYSNFQNRHTPPAFLDYNVAATEKSPFNLLNSTAVVNGAVTDSNTINVNNISANIYIGSVISWSGSPQGVIVENYASNVVTTNVNVSISNGVTLSFNQPSDDLYTTSSVEYPNSTLKTNRSYQVGIVLSDKFGRTSDVILSNNNNSITVGNETYAGASLYSPYIDSDVDANSWRGNSLKVSFNEPIGPANPDGFSPGLYNGEPSSPYYNPLGWYSYKIVVQQKEQEYYNVYAPGAIKGNITGASSNLSTSRIVLINDNINKVPRDLSEVGPQDKMFRSSVQLIGRVDNSAIAISNTGNEQYFPGRRTFTTNSIQPLFDAFDVSGPITINEEEHVFYRADSNPFLAEITTSQLVEEQFGVVNTSSTPFLVSENLIVLETKPVTSLLDIYYETSTTGLISDLNKAILNDLGISNSLNNFNYDTFTEAIADNGNINSTNFNLVDSFGVALIPSTDYSNFVLLSAFDHQDPAQNVLSVPGGAYFSLVETANTNSYNVKVTPNFVNNIYYGSNQLTRVFTLTFRVTLATGENIDYIETIELANVAPEMYRNPNNPPSSGDVVAAEATVGSPSNPTPTSQINIKTMYGRNGANTSDNPNTREDLEWEIVSVLNSAGRNATGSTNFTLEVNNEAAYPLVQKCIVKNSLVPASSIPNDNYELTINLSDAGGAIRNLILNIIYSAIPTQLNERNYTIGGFSYNEFVEVQFEGLDSGNGWYIYTGSWSELTASIIFGNTIVINNPIQSSSSCPANASSNNVWYYGGSTNASLTIARNKIVSCFPGTNLSTGGSISIPDASDFGWDV